MLDSVKNTKLDNGLNVLPVEIEIKNVNKHIEADLVAHLTQQVLETFCCWVFLLFVSCP